MNQNSRTKNSILNFIANFAGQAVVLVLAFLTRRVFINSLGVEYLGISSLFNNILSVLSIAELGVGSSMYYAMYGAIAKNDIEKIKGLTTYYKGLYIKIAFTIFALGLCMLPFLRMIVNVDRTITHLELYYIIILLNSVFSYFFMYKTAVLYADQKGYKLKAFNVIVSIIRTIVEIFILVYIKKYMLYLIVSPFFVLLSNIVSVKVTEKYYPFVKEKGTLDIKEKKNVWKNIKSMFMYKIGGVVLNNTDNILISIIVNTNMVGYYSNYTMITSKLFSIINMIFDSFNNSIGNLNATSDKEKVYKFFNVISFMAYWLFSFACIGIFFIGEDIIKMMTGSLSYILPRNILIITILNFYLKVSKNPITMYRETTGLFKKTKYSIICSAFLNIVFSIIFGKMWGLFGILLATLVSRFLCDVWYEPFILYKDIFEKNVKEYLFMQIKYFFLTIILVLCMMPVFSMISFENLYFTIIVKTIVCSIIVNVVFFVVFWKKEEFIYIKDRIKVILHKLLNLKLNT